MTRSILSNWFGLVVLAASTAFLTPIMIHHLGAVDFGIWVFASSVLDYYGLLDLGMRSAMFRYVALFRGGTVREEVDRTFSSALLLAVVTSSLICILSVGVALLLPRYMSHHSSPASGLSWLLLLLGISVAVTFPTRMLATYISAHQRWDLYNAAGIANTVTRGVAIIIVLKMGYGMLAVAIATVVVAFLSLGQHILLLVVADPQVHVRIRLITIRRIRELFAFSMRSTLVSIGDYLRFYSDSAVIASVLGVGLVTPFNVATRLIECFRSVIIAAGGPVLGTMTQLDGAHREKDLREMLLRSTRLLALLSVLGGVLLLVDGRALLQVWVGKELVSAYPILAVLTLGYIINMAQHPALLVIIAKGKHGPLGWWSIAEGVANIGLSIIWGMSHGLLGIAAATIVPMLVMKIFIQPWYALNAVEMSMWEYLAGGLGRALLVGVLFAGVIAKISINTETTIPLFTAMVAFQVITFVAIAWIIGLTSAERQWVWEYGRKLLTSPALRQALRLSPERTNIDFRENE
jgi:O-antigen/teichoic acid export membrane protein